MPLAPKIVDARGYWRVTYVGADGKRRHVWATRYDESGVLVKFFLVNKQGDEYDPRQLVIASRRDVVRRRPCVWNLTYAELEVSHGA